MTDFALATFTLGAVGATLPWAQQRLALSRAKHRSLAGHSRMAKRVVSMIPGYAYDEAGFFCADGAPQAVVGLRQQGFERLCQVYAQR